MTATEKVATYSALALLLVGAALCWLIHWALGLAVTLLIVGSAGWYLKTKRKGDTYLQDLARMLGCRFETGGAGYGRVVGRYQGREIEVSVNKDYDALRGIGGFALSGMLMDSALGVVAGITNFTSVKLSHDGQVAEPSQLDNQTFIDRRLVVYLPPSNRATGLPKVNVSGLVSEIDRLVQRARALEQQ